MVENMGGSKYYVSAHSDHQVDLGLSVSGQFKIEFVPTLVESNMKSLFSNLI